MPVSEKQLETWSHQGSVTQSKQTYASVKDALQSADAPYSAKSFEVFLQGSYGNDTNIYADSDVDAVIMLTSTFYSDLGNLSTEERAVYDRGKSPASYSYDDFKAVVVKHLTSKFGSRVKAGKKAIFIPGDGARRDCDVLACAAHRRYYRYRSVLDQGYHAGICFWLPDGTQIINFPRQHSANCTTKHQATSSWFKPSVRILKNMRNSMVEKGYLKQGFAPSYFLEGMLYNVPNHLFGRTYQNSIASALDWLIKCDRSKLQCANELYYLCHPTSPVTWRAEYLQIYLDAAANFWRDWGA